MGVITMETLAVVLVAQLMEMLGQAEEGVRVQQAELPILRVMSAELVLKAQSGQRESLMVPEVELEVVVEILPDLVVSLEQQ